MSLIKKAHSLLLLARAENNPKKALILRKASYDFYNEMIIVAFIYGVVTQKDGFAEVALSLSGTGTLTEKVAKIIAQSEGLSKPTAIRLAREFFEAGDLGGINFYGKMIRDFTLALKSKDKAEDAVQNIFAGINPITESEYGKTEARNPFAHAGKEHMTLPTLFMNTVSKLREYPNAPIENKGEVCKASILKTLGILEQRLKFNTKRVVPIQLEDVSVGGKPLSEVKDISSEPEAPLLKFVTEETVDKFLKLFQKGYGWKSIRTPKAQRRALSHILFCMEVHYERADLESLITNNEELTLLNQLDMSPSKVLSLGTVEGQNTLHSSLTNLIAMVSSLSTDFLDMLISIYQGINQIDDIKETVNKKAFTDGWKRFLKEIGNDIQALKADSELLIPSASPIIDDMESILKQGSKKKASMKDRVASLLKRYYQI